MGTREGGVAEARATGYWGRLLFLGILPGPPPKVLVVAGSRGSGTPSTSARPIWPSAADRPEAGASYPCHPAQRPRPGCGEQRPAGGGRRPDRGNRPLGGAGPLGVGSYGAIGGSVQVGLGITLIFRDAWPGARWGRGRNGAPTVPPPGPARGDTGERAPPACSWPAWWGRETRSPWSGNDPPG